MTLIRPELHRAPTPKGLTGAAVARRASTVAAAVAAVLGAAFAPQALAQQATAEQLQTLKDQINRLQQQVEQLQAQQAQQQAQQPAQNPPAPAPAPASAAKSTHFGGDEVAAGLKLSDLAYGKVKIGATFYADYAYYTKTGFGPQFLTQMNQDGPGNGGFNTFDVTRTYINFLYLPNDDITLRLTPNIYRQVDVSNGISAGKNAGIASSSNGNLGFRLKYAYVQFNSLFKGSSALGKDYVRFGQTMNPLVDWEEALWGYRYVSLVPWNYLSLSSTYTGVVIGGPLQVNGKEYLDYQIGAFNTSSFHAIETNDKKQGMARVTWYPFGTTKDRTSLGITGFYDYGWNTKTPDSPSTRIDRAAAIVHYQDPAGAYLIAGEYDWGRNAFSTGNLFSGAGPADALGLAPTPTPYAAFSSMSSAILGANDARQKGYAFFGHAKLWGSFAAFGMYQQFKPNTKIGGTNPLDFQRIVLGLSYDYNSHLSFALDDQMLNYFHEQFTMSPAQMATFSGSLAAAHPGGIPGAVPVDTNVIMLNVQFSY